MPESMTPPQPLGTYALGRSPINFASGMVAGDLVFLNGLLAESCGQRPHTLLGNPAALDEATSIWNKACLLLESAGAGIERIVRADQFFTDWRSVPFFHQTRKQHCKISAPSTSILQSGLLLPGATMAMDLLAFKNGEDVRQDIFPADLDIPATSAFAPVVRLNDWVFIAGFMAAQGVGDLGGIASEAKVPDGHLWKGNRIQLETEYIIHRKLIPALTSAGLTLAHVRKASICLSDMHDLPALNQVWFKAFGGQPPATTLIPTPSPGFAISDARVEINLIAHAEQPVAALPAPAECRHAFGPGYPMAARIGDFLVFSGAMAIDDDGAVGVKEKNGLGYQASLIEEQMTWLIDAFERFCITQGACLSNVVKISHLHTDMNDFMPACRAWQRKLPNIALPISAMKVASLATVEACVQAEIWVYAPETSPQRKEKQ